MLDDAGLLRLREILARRPAVEIDAPQHRRACVLLPLVRSGSSWSVLFTRRAENMASHSGQIAFPGGAVEEGESLDQAAIREAEEEVGIPQRHVEIIGRLDDVVTHSGFLVGVTASSCSGIWMATLVVADPSQPCGTLIVATVYDPA